MMMKHGVALGVEYGLEPDEAWQGIVEGTVVVVALMLDTEVPGYVLEMYQDMEFGDTWVGYKHQEEPDLLQYLPLDVFTDLMVE